MAILWWVPIVVSQHARCADTNYANTMVITSKLKFPPPKSFDGVRSFKKLEKFLWDMKQYFDIAKIGVGK
jgi:hypothetical protein